MNTGNISIKASVSGNTPGLKGEKGNGIKSTVLNDDYSLTFNYTNGTSDTTPPIRGQKGEKGDNGISPSITTSKSGKVTTITIKDATGTKVATINDGVDSQGDMLKSTYDKNSNGIVDNSEKVNGHTVESNVPANAKFTDTIYTHPINSGNKHIPSGGSSGQILKWEEDGAAKWDDSIEAHREGTELKVNNYKQLIKFTKEGKTEQKTYTGKNLFSSKLEVGGIDTTTGLNATNNIRKRTKDFISIQPNTTYTFSYKSQGDYAKWGWYILYDNNQQIVSSYSFENDYDVTFTSSNDAYYFKMYFGNVENVDVNSFDCQLEEGSEATEFEPYVGAIASPNPDYPQEIVNVRGVENLFEPTLTINGTNIKQSWGTFALDGDEFVITAGGSDLYFGEVAMKANTNYQNSYGVLIPVEPNTVYNCKINNRLFAKNYITEWNSDKKSLRYQPMGSNSITFTTGSDTAYISLRFGYSNSTNGDVYRVKVKIEKGSTIHDYVPYGSNYLILNNKSDNLANINEIKIGKTWQNVSTNSRASIIQIKINPNTTYTLNSNYKINSNFTTCRAMLFNNISGAVKYATNDIGTFNSKECNYLSIELMSNTSITEEMLNGIWISLAEGNEASNIPYFNDNMLIDLKGNELCSNLDKTTNDELIVENSKAKINKIIKEFTFTGDEEFTKRNDGDGSTTITFNLPIHEDIVELNTVSNMFSYEQSSTSGNEGMGVSIGNNKLVYIQIKRSRLSSLDVAGFKEFLKAKYNAGIPLKIQCELIGPEVIDLGEVDFDLIENSTLTCEEESNMQIDYLTISSNIFVQDSLDGNSSQKAPSINAVNEIISKLEARIIALENKNV
nr:MAG TPA: hypothetical protein [Caudoviricetes sp.]